MTSDDGMLITSAQAKLNEFARIGDPMEVRKQACVGLGYATGNSTWYVLSKCKSKVSAW